MVGDRTQVLQDELCRLRLRTKKQSNEQLATPTYHKQHTSHIHLLYLFNESGTGGLGKGGPIVILFWISVI